MDEINFPMTRINSKSWLDKEDLFPLFNGYIYTSKEKLFNDYYRNKEFVDCKGDIYKVIDRIPPTNFWRNFLKFLPNVYREKLVFIKTNKRIELMELKKDLISGIRRFNNDATSEAGKEWIMEIERSKSIKEVLCGVQ